MVAAAPAGAGSPQHPVVRDGLSALDALASSCVGRDAADNNTGNGTSLPYRFCDDGVPPSGGGARGIPVPAAYEATPAGGDYTGLPAPGSPATVAAAQARDDIRPERDVRITLDVDVSLPPATAVPATGAPVVVFMHGCCAGDKRSWEANTIDDGGERWHHSNAWFASRGFVVLTYTARGFRNANDQGSTGTTQLDSRRYEMNDYQHLVGLLADHDAERRAAGQSPVFNTDPTKVVPVGGSYGGGFAWMALTDPTWRSPAHDVAISTAAVVTKYGWTDLAESLLASGHGFDRDPGTGEPFVAPATPEQALSRSPIGTQKQSIVAGLYATGNLMNSNHTTFPDHVHETYARLQAGEPYEGDPIIEEEVWRLISDSSAYYQTEFWRRVEHEKLRVPVFAAGTWTDPLFPTNETIRFYNKLIALRRNYPIEMNFGNYQHFTPNHAKEWGDICGADHHVCRLSDYLRADGSLDLDSDPATLVHTGINTRINRFVNHAVLGLAGDHKYGVSASVTVCPSTADEAHRVDEPGERYIAPTWSKLSSGTRMLQLAGGGATSSAFPDGHAAGDPLVNLATNGNQCYTPGDPSPGPGVVQVASAPIDRPFTMMGSPTLRMDIETAAPHYWIAARLFDREPDGTMTMVGRGSCTVDRLNHPESGCGVFDLSGNAWNLKTGHQLVVELTQSDTPYLRRSNVPSVLTLSDVRLEVPIAAAKRLSDPRFP